MSPRLQVRVCAGDLRDAGVPLLVGHYEHDPIAGPQALIDRELLGGALGERHRLGLYAGALGSATVVLPPPRPGAGLQGAVVTGLGPYDGTLGARELTEAVRTGALRLLLQVRDQFGPGERALALGSLLIGYNSSATLSLETVVEALVRGVIEAGRRFAEVAGPAIRIERLDLIELHTDIALSAARVLQRLETALRTAAWREGLRLDCAATLVEGEGRRPRLGEARGASYWPRLLVGLEGGQLHFLHLGARARAEARGQPLQPGLLGALLQPGGGRDDDLGRMLFHLLVPPEMLDVARQLGQMVLVVDARSAAIPWEMLVADEDGGRRGAPADRPAGPPALALEAPLVRQLAGEVWRRQVRRSAGRAALVVGNPRHDRADLPDLSGAEQEAVEIEQVLQRCDHEPVRLSGADASADRVLRQLYRQPLRLVHLSAHGVVDEPQPDGSRRTGVVLSGGLVLTAVELAAMDPVPELVFLNCCHLGRIDAPAPPDVTPPGLAASLAQALIGIGVRCVIAAGWAVDDEGARCFGRTFYEALLGEGRAFGEAVFAARRATWEAGQGRDATWGAFQAYGDPAWRAGRTAAEPRSACAGATEPQLLGTDELIEALRDLRRGAGRDPGDPDGERPRAALQALVDRVPPDWLERTTVQAELGRTWAELGQAAPAVALLRRALACRGATLPLQGVEQLAGAELMLARRDDDLALARTALRRLQRLALLRRERGEPAGAEQALAAARLGVAALQARALLASSPGAAQAAALRRLQASLDQGAALLAGDEALTERITLAALRAPQTPPQAAAWRRQLQAARRAGRPAGTTVDPLREPRARLAEWLLQPHPAPTGRGAPARPIETLQALWHQALTQRALSLAQHADALARLEDLVWIARALALPADAGDRPRALARELGQLQGMLKATTQASEAPGAPA